MSESSLTEDLKKIKPINSESVHKICSGQVVLSLAVAVKELVENSLDATSTIIDVRLKNYGVELIEVSDNGSGVTEDNFPALTLKYHTSKLTEYSDLLGVSSFGFRGEALSSLCALSDLTITTRHQSYDFATKIEYDHKGNIKKTTLCSRQVGTTVTLTNLFSTLPVRQKELHKNSKREFNKMTQLLYAYCLISVGVKITCTNQTSAGSKSIVVATQGSNSYRDNIACVFGSKQLNSIFELKPHYEPNIKDNILKGLSGEVESSDSTVNIDDVEIDLSEDSNEPVDSTQDSIPSQKSQGYTNSSTCPIEFNGYISSCAHGSGRSSTDRQFYFVNSRPCEPVKVIKLINETYRQYNPNQYPFIFLNIILDRTCVDVNVTPDKRKVFLTKEKVIMDVVKSSLVHVYESIPRTLKVEATSNIASYLEDVKPVVDKPRIFNSFLHRFANKNAVEENPKSTVSNGELKRKSKTLLDYVSTSKVMKLDRTIEDFDKKSDNPTSVTEIASNEVLEDGNESKIAVNDDDSTIDDIKNETNTDSTTKSKSNIMYLQFSDDVPNTQIRQLDEVIIEKSHTVICKSKDQTRKKSPAKLETLKTEKKLRTDKEDLGKYNRKCVQMKTCLEHVKALTDIYNKEKLKSAPERVKFRTGINPVFNKKCEEELSKEISKDSFKQMVVVGQFNLGFIITRLEDDLFIIDQHATDEIYNFETLQKTTELTNQKLVIPQQLELTGVNEQILMDNLEVFRKNGFSFEINENAPPTKRVKLLTIPMSKNWIFGKEDIEELLFMLRESPSEYCRPSRVRAMFASRACRKSVMIGTALTKVDMKKLVDHMSEIDKPWNCPHGRPTIRHLVNLAMVRTKDEES